MTTPQYIHLSYEDYKHLQSQLEDLKETTHTTTGGFYHKSIRLRITPNLIMEFHGPNVGGYGHHEEAAKVVQAKTTHRGLNHPNGPPVSVVGAEYMNTD